MSNDTDSSAASSRPGNGRNNRLSADDWAQAALDLIAEQGVGAVAVEPLARRLGVTKGSFYWHFPSRDALLQAALERWELFEQEQVFGSLEDVPDPSARLRALFQLVAHEVKPHAIYSELLKALDHPAVRPVIDRVSQRRLDYLVASFRQAASAAPMPSTAPAWPMPRTSVSCSCRCSCSNPSRPARNSSPTSSM